MSNMRISHQVWKANPGITVEIAFRIAHVEAGAAHPGGVVSEFPAADDEIHGARRIAQELFSFANGQLVDAGHGEYMVALPGRSAVFNLREIQEDRRIVVSGVGPGVYT